MAVTESDPIGMTDVQPASQRPRRRMRRWLEWTSLARNVLGATKDFGIIAIFLALLFFNQEVLDYLEERGASFGSPPPPPVDVPSGLARLNRGANSLPVTTEATQGALAPVGGKAGRKVSRAEQRLLRSDEAEYINDWALVISATSDIQSAKGLAASLHPGPGLQVRVYKKDSARLVVPLGRTEQARTLIPVVRAAYPGSVLVSLSSWCSVPIEESGVFVCK